MTRTIVANAIFAALIWGFYAWCNGDRAIFFPALVLAAIAYSTGLMVGMYKMRPGARRRSISKSDLDVSAFDQIQ